MLAKILAFKLQISIILMASLLATAYIKSITSKLTIDVKGLHCMDTSEIIKNRRDKNFQFLIYKFYLKVKSIFKPLLIGTKIDQYRIVKKYSNDENITHENSNQNLSVLKKSSDEDLIEIFFNQIIRSKYIHTKELTVSEKLLFIYLYSEMTAINIFNSFNVSAAKEYYIWLTTRSNNPSLYKCKNVQKVIDLFDSSFYGYRNHDSNTDASIRPFSFNGDFCSDNLFEDFDFKNGSLDSKILEYRENFDMIDTDDRLDDLPELLSNKNIPKLIKKNKKIKNIISKSGQSNIIEEDSITITSSDNIPYERTENVTSFNSEKGLNNNDLFTKYDCSLPDISKRIDSWSKNPCKNLTYLIGEKSSSDYIRMKNKDTTLNTKRLYQDKGSQLNFYLSPQLSADESSKLGSKNNDKTSSGHIVVNGLSYNHSNISNISIENGNNDKTVSSLISANELCYNNGNISNISIESNNDKNNKSVSSSVSGNELGYDYDTISTPSVENGNSLLLNDYIPHDKLSERFITEERLESLSNLKIVKKPEENSKTHSSIQKENGDNKSFTVSSDLLSSIQRSEIDSEIIFKNYYRFYKKLISCLSIEKWPIGTIVRDRELLVRTLYMIKSIKIRSSAAFNLIGKYFKYLKNITEIDISNLQITEISKNLTSLTYLNSLNISNNILSIKSANSIIGLKQLKHLYANNTGYNFISNFLISYKLIRKKVKNTDLTNQKLKHRHDLFRSNNDNIGLKEYDRNLDKLSDKRTTVSEIPTMAKLRSLFIDNNKICHKTLENCAMIFDSLEILSCANNYISDISPLINFNKIAYIDLSNNPIEKDPFIYLIRCRGLQEIKLIGTLVKEMKIDFEYFPNLNKVELDKYLRNGCGPTVILKGDPPKHFTLIGSANVIRI